MQVFSAHAVLKLTSETVMMRRSTHTRITVVVRRLAQKWEMGLREPPVLAQIACHREETGKL